MSPSAADPAAAAGAAPQRLSSPGQGSPAGTYQPGRACTREAVEPRSPNEEPQLPTRRRKTPGASPETQERVTSGAAALLWLGASRVALPCASGLELGTVTAWCEPWFEVRLDGGRVTRLRKREVEDALLFNPGDFFDPRLFYFDFGTLNPLRVAGWSCALRAHLERFDVALPLQWLGHRDEEGADEAATFATVEGFREATRRRAQHTHLELAGGARAERTLANLKHPAFKALWWLAAMGRQLPPTQADIADYLAFLYDRVDTVGSATDARAAIGFIADVNADKGWARDALLGGRAAIPIEALRRRHTHDVRKAPGLPPDAVRAILQSYAFVRPDLPWQQQWRLAFGISVGAALKTMARYSDSAVLRYDEGFFVAYPTHVDVKFWSRKTHAFESHWVTIARPLDGSFGVYDALIVGKAVFSSGFILPHVDAEGRVHRDRPMSYDDYVRHLRAALQHVGYSEEQAHEFTAHSARSGAATEMVHSGLNPILGCAVAGVKSVDWFIGYMRASLPDRLRASLSICPF